MRKHFLKKDWATLGVLVLGAAVTVAVVWAGHEQSVRVAGEIVNRRALFVAEAVASSVGATVEDAVASAALFVASEEVTETDFSRFVEDIGQYPGALGLAYVPWVSASEFAPFLDDARRSDRGFSLFRLAQGGSRVVNDSDPTAYPVRYFVSASGADIDLRGFDAASDPAWVAVLERAAQRETVQVSRLTQLFGVPGQWGFVARFDNAAGLLDAVQTGRIDVAALTTISLGSLAQTTDFAGVEVTEGFAYREQVGCGAFGFRREDTRFRDEFNRILNQMKDDGELTRLVEPFGFAEAAGAAQGLTAEELCAG